MLRASLAAAGSANPITSAKAHPAIRTLRVCTVGAVLACIVSGISQPAMAQPALAQGAADLPAFAPGMINHMQAMRRFKDRDQGVQPTPNVIPKFEIDRDASGAIAIVPVRRTNIHQEQCVLPESWNQREDLFHLPSTSDNGWTVSAASVADRFAESAGADPIFRLVDGATCPTADVSNPSAKRQAYKLLTDKGLIRIGLPMPDPTILQFAVTAVSDPYHCTTNPATGLTSETAGIVSIYRRPLPSTNLGFLSTIMWDGREPTLTSQAIDATLGHAQANAAPNAVQQSQMVAFETDLFTAQAVDKHAGSLNDHNATGGPIALSMQLATFFIGVNDPLGNNPKGQPFSPNIFDLYRPWLGVLDDLRRSIARGEEVFNTTNINITGVAGLNDALNVASIPGFCGTCHDTPNVGNHSVKAPLNIGIADAGAKSPPVLDVSGLPVFTLTCMKGPLASQIFTVTDPGRALISGQCADIGKLKGPILRGLAARAPYFHNGSAATLLDVVNFYDQRFSIGFTDREKNDLVNFLNAL